MIFPDGLKTLLVEITIECPMCGKVLKKGDLMYRDNYRGDIFCGYCKEEYKDDVLAEEGEDGRLLK